MDDPKPDGWHYSGSPESIWALPQELRAAAVADIFRQASQGYVDAVARDDVKAAQEYAVTAVQVVGGLFPERGDPAHIMILGIVAAIIDARGGSKRHILLRAGARVPGTKGGLGHVLIAASAVAATAILHERGMSKLSARKEIARILAERGYSLKRDDHAQSKPVTWSAIRNWEEKSEAFPMVEAVWPRVKKTLEGDIASNGLSTLAEIIGLFEGHADKLLPQTLAF